MCLASGRQVDTHVMYKLQAYRHIDIWGVHNVWYSHTCWQVKRVGIDNIWTICRHVAPEELMSIKKFLQVQLVYRVYGLSLDILHCCWCAYFHQGNNKLKRAALWSKGSVTISCLIQIQNIPANICSGTVFKCHEAVIRKFHSSHLSWRTRPS